MPEPDPAADPTRVGDPERVGDPTRVGDPKRVVEDGYDAIAERYLEWSGTDPSLARLRALRWLLRELAAPSDILELGCGAGVPMTRALAERHRVLGVDISARQVALARRNVPAARFRKDDLSGLRFPPDSFDAVVAFYALTHVPRDEQPDLLRRIAAWLRPGGVFFATMGAAAAEGVEDDWLGAPMFFSHHDAATNEQLVRDAGLRIVLSEVRAEDEDGTTVSFLWLAARKLS